LSSAGHFSDTAPSAARALPLPGPASGDRSRGHRSRRLYWRVVRLTDSQIAGERYRGEPSTDDDGRTLWPMCVIWDDEVQGFGVRIHPPVRGKPPRKDFVVAFKVGARSRMMALGTVGVDCSLRQARRAARQALDLARRGQDPLEKRRRDMGIGTPEDLASRFLTEHSAARRKNASTLEAPPPPGESIGEILQHVDPIAALDGQPAAVPPRAIDAPEASNAPDAAKQPEAPVADAVSPDAAPVESSPIAGASAALPVDAEPGPAVAPLGPDPDAVSAMSRASAAPDPAPLDASPAPTIEAPAPVPAIEAPAATAAADPPLPPPALATDPPFAPPAAAAAEAERRTPPPPFKRGPARMRLLSLPEALHREIERRARAANLTIGGYLVGLIERDTPVLAPEALRRAGYDVPTVADGEVLSPAEIMARVQASQAIDVVKLATDGPEEKPDEPGE
jgi:hypothetical protein